MKQKNQIASQLEKQIRIALGLPPVRTKTCPIVRICTVVTHNEDARNFSISDEGEEGRMFILTKKASKVVVSGGKLQTVQKSKDEPKAPEVGDVLVVLTAFNADCIRPSHWGHLSELATFTPGPAFGSLEHALGTENVLADLDVVAIIRDADLSSPSPAELEGAARELSGVETLIESALLTVVPGDDDDPEELVASVTENGIVHQIEDTRTSKHLNLKVGEFPRVTKLKQTKAPSLSSSSATAKPQSKSPLLRRRKQVEALVAG